MSVKLTHFCKEVDIYDNRENEKLVLLSFMYIKYPPPFPFSIFRSFFMS